MPPGRATAILLTALMLAACHGDTRQSVGCRETPSGLPVPRFVTLKHDPANARGGPGDDYRLLWVYHNKRLPLLVFEETTDWRKVRDPEGQLAWVHKRVVLEGARSVMRTASVPLSLRDHPAADARVTAVLASHAIASLKTCADNWCQVSVDQASGWAPRTELWGAEVPPLGEGCRRP
jgi:SH3-like domain-containing protein